MCIWNIIDYDYTNNYLSIMSYIYDLYSFSKAQHLVLWALWWHQLFPTRWLEPHWWVLGRTKHVSVDMYSLNFFMEYSGEHWWEQNIFLSVHHKRFGKAQHLVLWALWWHQLFSTRWPEPPWWILGRTKDVSVDIYIYIYTYIIYIYIYIYIYYIYIYVSIMSEYPILGAEIASARKLF